MTDNAHSVRATVRETLDAWRERGADRLDPLRFHFIEALDRRAAQHDGEARRLLDERLSALIDAYAEDLARAACDIPEAREMASTRGPLGALVDEIARDTRALSDDAILDYFRETWSKFSTERQLRHSLEQVPGNAGPLNSSSLVHRSLSLMREVSPGYLRQFLSYVDALSWLEQLNGNASTPGKDAPRAASETKSGRKKSR